MSPPSAIKLLGASFAAPVPQLRVDASGMRQKKKKKDCGSLLFVRGDFSAESACFLLRLAKSCGLLVPHRRVSLVALRFICIAHS